MYTVYENYVEVIGEIWMPAITCAMRYAVCPQDVADEHGAITRESVEDWTTCHTGDFQKITDFSAHIDGSARDPLGISIDWADEESELTYNGCMFPEE